MEDRQWLNRIGEYKRTRRATLRPDEEPDDDMLTADQARSRQLAREKELREESHRPAHRRRP